MNRHWTKVLWVCAAWLLLCCVFLPTARAEERLCGSLKPEHRLAAQALFERMHPYDCCDKTLAQCLKAKPTCRLARRLSEDICRRVLAGQSRVDIERELERRAASMTPMGKSAAIGSSPSMLAGDPASKVTVAVYLCPRCPFCSKLLPGLHASVTRGRLAGKVKLLARPFPVRAHPGSTEAGLGLVAAAQLGKFWEFLLRLYQDFDQFDPAHVDAIAVKVGLDRAKFSERLALPETRQALVDMKKEGVKNAIESTPTFFINGRRYTGEMTLATLEDLLEEEHDRVTGKLKE